MTILVLLMYLATQDGKEASDEASQRVRLQASDGVRLAALFFEAELQPGEKKRPALLLLHGGNRRKERWLSTGFVSHLRDARYHMLAIDLRGRGESEIGDEESLRRDPTLALKDLDAAMAWLKEREDVDEDAIALVGSSYGANLATSALLTDRLDVATVVCFSATEVLFKFVSKFEKRALIPSGLYLASRSELERYGAARAARRLAGQTEGDSRVEVFEGSVHALALFQTEERVGPMVRAWLEEQLD